MSRDWRNNTNFKFIIKNMYQIDHIFFSSRCLLHSGWWIVFTQNVITFQIRNRVDEIHQRKTSFQPFVGIGGHMTPLDVFWKFLVNRAPEAHQIFALRLIFGSTNFGTTRRSVCLTGGHQRLIGFVRNRNSTILHKVEFVILCLFCITFSTFTHLHPPAPSVQSSQCAPHLIIADSFPFYDEANPALLAT